jgi:hypothetical protein
MSDTNADHDADGEQSVAGSLAAAFPIVATVLAMSDAERRAMLASLLAKLEALGDRTRAVLAGVLTGEGSSRRSLATDARAQGTNLVSLFIGILIAAVIGISVAIPVINDTIANANLSGTTATVVGLLDLFIGLMLLVGLASPLMRRV